MAKTNALTEWLEIPPAEQPPNHYRLLGLPLFETDRAKINAAAEDAMARVRQAAGGERMDLSGKVLTMIKSARTCLLNDATRTEYDAQLRESLGLNANPVVTSAPVIKTGNAPTAADRARQKKRSSLPMILIAAVAGGGLAAGLVFSGVIPLFKKPDKDPQGDRVAQDDRDAKSDPRDLGKSLGSDGAKRTAPANPSKAVPVTAASAYLAELPAAEVKLHLELGWKFTVNNVQPKHGLWLHPARGGTGRIAYHLGRKYRWLQGLAVIPDSSHGTREMTVRVIGDGKVLWESQPLKEKGARQEFTVDVANVKKLAITSREATGSFDHAHVALVNPRLFVEPDKPAAMQVAGITDAAKTGTTPSAVAAVLDVTDRKQTAPLSKYEWTGLPEYLKGGSFYASASGTKATLRGNEIEFVVKKPGLVVMLASWQYDGNRNGGWYETRTSPETLKRDRWTRLDKTSLSLMGNAHEYAIYAREFKAGEKVRLHTRKYNPPILVALNSEQAGKVSAMLGNAGGTVATAATKARTVDLLKLIDPDKHKLRGAWSKVDGDLVTKNGDLANLQIPFSPPQEYELHLTATRQAGTVADPMLNIGLVAGGRHFSAVIDVRGKWSGLHVLDGKRGVQVNESFHDVAVLQDGKPANIICRVRKTRVAVLVDGKTIVDWKGEFSRLSPYSVHFPVPNAERLSLGANCDFRFSKIELRMAADAGTVDLLKLVDLEKHARNGKWRFDNKDLIGSASGLIEIPYALPDEYDVHVTAKREPGNGFSALHIGLAAQGRQFAVVLDFPGQLNGLFRFDVQGTFDPATNPTITKAETLTAGKARNIICKVRRKSVQVTVDGRKVIDWSGDFSRLSVDPAMKVIQPNHMSFRAGDNVTFRFSKIELRPLNTGVASGVLLAIPAAAAQQKSLALIKDIFKTEYAAATKPLQKSTLAGKLLTQAGKTVDDETARYVLLRESQRLANEAGDLPAVLLAVDEIAAKFTIDVIAEKGDILRRFAGLARFPAQRKIVADATFDLAKAAAEAKQFEASLKLLKLASTTAGKGRLRTLARSINDFRGTVIARQKQLAAAEAAAKTLLTKPDDPEANLVRGRYLCFVKRDWTNGLPLLAKGSDDTLKLLAQRELKSPADAKDMIDVADAWYDAALKAKDASPRTAMAVRAASWYREAEPSVTGLYKTKVEKQLAEIDRRKLIPAGTAIDKLLRVRSPSSKPSLPANQPPAAAAGKTPLYVWEISSGVSILEQNPRIEFFPGGSTNHTKQNWTLDGKKFVFGWDSGGTLTADNLHAYGRWWSGSYFTARLLMKNIALKSESAPKAKLPANAGGTWLRNIPVGSLEKRVIDCWELTAATRGARKFVRLTVDFTADHDVISFGARIGRWKIDGRNIVVSFLDGALGDVTLGLRNANELFGRSKPRQAGTWSLQLNRVQKVAVYRTDNLGTLTFYSNGRLNSPRHDSGKNLHWYLDGKSLWVRDYRLTMEAGGRAFTGGNLGGGGLKGTLVAGRPVAAK